MAADPDHLLEDEHVLAELIGQGYRIIAETDPVLLRARYEEARPTTLEHPLIVITPGPLNELPYDLWQQGRREELALHQFFRNLDYPTLRTLSSTQPLA